MKQLQNDPYQLLTEAQAAILIGYSQRTLQNWRQRGDGPKYVKVSARSIRYQRRDVLNWIEALKRSHTVQGFR